MNEGWGAVYLIAGTLMAVFWRRLGRAVAAFELPPFLDKIIGHERYIWRTQFGFLGVGIAGIIYGLSVIFA